MSEQLSEIVGQDVNLEAEQPTPEVEQPEQGSEQPQEAAQEQQQPEQQDSRTVPLAALHEERQKRKELAAEVQRIREENARREAIVEQRLAALTQQRQEAQVPAFEENPAEHLRHQIGQVQQVSQETQQQIHAWQQQQQQEAHIRQLASVVHSHESAFVQQTPDYAEAVGYLRNQRAAEMMADGIDEQTALQTAHQELVRLALTRANAGQNPAEAAYKIAKARGYSAKPANVQPTPAERIQNQQKGTAAAKTLGSGGPANNKITAEALASMSDEDFAELTKGNNWQKLMG